MKCFFFEKTFALCVKPPVQMGPSGGALKQVKVFWFFFSKKNCFLALACLVR
jgi:hypothetical protein